VNGREHDGPEDGEARQAAEKIQTYGTAKAVPYKSHSYEGFKVCVRTSETQTFEREPGRTADPSAALGMTKGRASASMYRC
jgi:hypothetical protein